MKFKVVIEPDGDGFHARVPSLPGCGTWGKTEQEALANIREAILLYLEPDKVVTTNGAKVYEVAVE